MERKLIAEFGKCVCNGAIRYGFIEEQFKLFGKDSYSFCYSEPDGSFCECIVGVTSVTLDLTKQEYNKAKQSALGYYHGRIESLQFHIERAKGLKKPSEKEKENFIRDCEAIIKDKEMWLKVIGNNNQ